MEQGKVVFETIAYNFIIVFKHKFFLIYKFGIDLLNLVAGI